MNRINFDGVSSVYNIPDANNIPQQYTRDMGELREAEILNDAEVVKSSEKNRKSLSYLKNLLGGIGSDIARVNVLAKSSDVFDSRQRQSDPILFSLDEITQFEHKINKEIENSNMKNPNQQHQVPMQYETTSYTNQPQQQQFASYQQPAPQDDGFKVAVVTKLDKLFENTTNILTLVTRLEKRIDAMEATLDITAENAYEGPNLVIQTLEETIGKYTWKGEEPTASQENLPPKRIVKSVKASPEKEESETKK